jgi:hypothetical protein
LIYRCVGCMDASLKQCNHYIIIQVRQQTQQYLEIFQILLCLFTDLYNNILIQHSGLDHIKNVIIASFCLTFTTCHIQGIKQTLPYVKISNLFSSYLSPLLSSLFPIGQLFKFLLLSNRINSQNLNTLFLLVRLHNTVPLSYWSFLSICLSVTVSLSLTLYPSKLLYKALRHPLTLSNPLSL